MHGVPDKGAEDAEDEYEASSAPPALADVTVRVRADVYPTEDVSAVRRGVRNLVPRVQLEHGTGALEGTASGPVVLARLRRRLRDQLIRDASRAHLLRRIQGDELVFLLNKQSSTMRVASFATEGAPLGDIEVHVGGADPRAVVEWLCQIEGA
jgi:predicted RNA binding protein with dsRBD fold (UPF0201 family)